MKAVSKLLYLDEDFFRGRIPEESRYLPDPGHDYPFFIREHLMSAQECDDLVENALNNGYRKPATVGAGTLATSIRRTDYLLPDPQFRALYLDRVNSIKADVEAFFGMQLAETGETQTYGYPPSGHYALHADDSIRRYNEQGELTHWKITNPNRTISTLFYLTDSVLELTGPNQCVGGNLSFEYLVDKDSNSCLIEPRKGMYIAFPSNPYFSHRVHEIHEGYRVVIVNWYARAR
jgi:SM-20-related protein